MSFLSVTGYLPVCPFCLLTTPGRPARHRAPAGTTGQGHIPTTDGGTARRAGDAPYLNRNLFSDDYLALRVPEHPEWHEEVGAAWSRALELYELHGAVLPKVSEAQTETDWIQPILTDVLGWSFIVQHETGLFGRRFKVDYALYTRPEDRAAANGSGALGRAAALAEAKHWGRPLDKEANDRGGGLNNSIPSFQIATYLFATGLDWGILTNGKEWRLYSMLARSRVETYFAVDLERILLARDEQGFRWFYLFFRAAAFRPDAGGTSFLRRVLDGSIRYGARLEEELRKRIYERVFPHLARGFAHWRREQGLPTDTPEALGEIYDGTLLLLYRLLFILYAESRGLLPVDDERGYARHGMVHVRARVAEALSSGFRLSDTAGGLWQDLSALFRIFDRGDRALNVPRYGGIFGPADPHGAFLDRHGVADAYLYPALDLLTRNDGQDLGYSSLNVRQLGSIYEGLLEYELRARPDGDVYLHHDKARRHGSGTYYTPEFVARYIVESTLAPLVEERAAEFRRLMGEIAPLREQLETAEAKLAEDPLRGDGGRWSAEATYAARELRVLERRAVDTMLGLRVCDPAMGSAHFLVDVADWLTEQLVIHLEEFPGNPVLRYVEEIRGLILADLDDQGVDGRPELLTDARILKRLLVKRCLYGVDLNPRVVKLAQVSLLLNSLTYGAQLSFVDHHLRAGNSLVGTTLPTVLHAATTRGTHQLDAFGSHFAGTLRASELVQEVANTVETTREEAAHSRALYNDMRRSVAPERMLLDAWTSRAFGNPAAERLVLDHTDEVRHVGGGGGNPFGKRQRDALDRARALADEHHFFHWDLEFPEVFYDQGHARWQDDPGFDAIVGNPPYVRQEQVGATKPYLVAEYADVHDGAADLYVYFYRRGVELLRRGGRLSYVVNNKWLRAGYGEPLRRYLAANAEVERIVDFGHAPVFPEADVFPCVVLLRKHDPDGEEPLTSTLVCSVPRAALEDDLGEFVASHGVSVPAERFAEAPWSLGGRTSRR